MRLIDADALINTLQELFDKRDKEARFTGDRGVTVTWNDAIYHIKTAPTIEPQRWIPVDEGKPKDGTACLVTYSRVHVRIATFAEDLYEVDKYDFHNKRGVAGWFYFNDEWGMCFDVDNVIAWMPLPEPYRSET